MGRPDDVLQLGLEADLEWLLAQAGQLRATGTSGATVFVSGDAGSGRSALLDAFAERAARGRAAPVVLAGAFESGHYVASNHVGDALHRAWRAVEGVVAVASPLLPFAAFAGQIVSQTNGARRLVQAMTDRPARQDPLALLPELLRRGAQSEGALVCVIDSADESDHGWWTDLMLSFARQAAVDLPVLLVFGIEGPTVLGEHELGETEPLFVARELVGQGFACWRPVPRVTEAALADWIGRADRRIPAAIVQATGGRAAWAADMWHEWRRDGLVSRGRDRPWTLSDGFDALAPASVSYCLGRRLENLLGDPDRRTLTWASQLLACAALEGREFTAEAVAAALRLESDEVIDFLDDRLAVNRNSEERLVDELPAVEVTDEAGRRRGWRYRFRTELDWLTLRHYGFPDDTRRRQMAGALTESLIGLYGGDAHRVARTLAALSRTAGDEDAARRFQRLHYRTADIETAAWRARHALESAPTASQYERNRATELLLAGAGALYLYGPWEEGRRFSEAASAFTNVLSLQSSALYYAAWFHAHLDDLATARRCLERALRGFEELNNKDGIANARHQLANLDYAEGRYEAAKEQYLDVLRLRESLRDVEQQSRVREALGNVFHEQNDPRRARAEYEAAIELALQINDHLSYANTASWIAKLDLEAGEVDRARARITEALGIQRDHRDRQHELSSLILLSDIEYEDERFEASAAAASAALALATDIGGKRLASALHERIGNAKWGLSDHDGARACYRTALALWEEQGDRGQVADVHQTLAALECEQGDHHRARTHFESVLHISLNTGDLAGEGKGRHGLADLLYNEDHLPAAREAYLAVLPLERNTGLLAEQAATHMRLAELAALDDDFDTARSHFEHSAACSRELGDPRNEAVAHRRLAWIDWHQGDRASAEKRLTTALALCRKAGDAAEEAEILEELRIVSAQSG